MSCEVNWEEIKKEYITTSTSIRKLADKYEISESTLKKKSGREKWKNDRDEYRAKLTQKIIEKESEKESQRFKRLLNVSDKLLNVVEEAVEAFRKEELVLDRGAIKQLSGAIKDIKDIQSIKSNLDIEEQKARIANLKKQAESDNNNVNEISIIIQGGDESWQQ